MQSYLKDWAKKLAGVPILSVDYSKGRPYPGAYQEALDVYLWLVSTSEAPAVLGFKPKKIVLVGDSAGGSLCLTLLLAVFDIKECFSGQVLTPSAFVSIFSGFRSVKSSPSKTLMSIIDPILSPGVLLASLGALEPSKIVPKRSHTGLKGLPQAGEEEDTFVSAFSLIEWPQIFEQPLVKKVAKLRLLLLKDLEILGKLVNLEVELGKRERETRIINHLKN